MRNVTKENELVWMFQGAFFNQILQQFGELVVIELRIQFGHKPSSQLRKNGYKMIRWYFG